MEGLFIGFTAITWQNLLMMAIGGVLIYLAIKKEYEPALLLPIGFGTILVNIPFSSVLDQVEGGRQIAGALSIFFRAGILTEIFPLLIFVAIGAMIDFSPLFRRPLLLLFGAAAQFGIFFTMTAATLLGFDLREAAAIGIIGSADGPTSIYVASRFAMNLIGPISVAAYSYMALVPIIQPPVIRMLTTRRERLIRMDGSQKKISRTTLILFPILVTILIGMFAPTAVALIGFLMFGNLVRECGVLKKLSLAAQNELASLVTLLLGITIASTMTADRFLQVSTLFIIALGLWRLYLRYRGRRTLRQVHEPFHKAEGKPHDRGGRHLGLPHVGACGAHHGQEGRLLQLPPDVCRQCERFRADRFRSGRRPDPDAGQVREGSFVHGDADNLQRGARGDRQGHGGALSLHVPVLHPSRGARQGFSRRCRRRGPGGLRPETGCNHPALPAITGRGFLLNSWFP